MPSLSPSARVTWRLVRVRATGLLPALVMAAGWPAGRCVGIVPAVALSAQGLLSHLDNSVVSERNSQVSQKKNRELAAV